MAAVFCALAWRVGRGAEEAGDCDVDLDARLDIDIDVVDVVVDVNMATWKKS